MTTIQVREVPEHIAEALRRRAAARGKSLSDYLRDEYERLAMTPDRHETLERIRSRTPQRDVNVVEELRAMRHERDHAGR